MRPRTNILIAAIASLAVALAGCMVGPNYTRPTVEQPTAFKSQATTQPAPPIAAEWWRLYHDDELDRLIASAKESNQNLRQAVARVDQARALARVAASYLAPTISADPNYTRTRTSANRPSVPLDLTYEIDVWGRVRRSVESSNAQVAATADDLAVVHLTVATDVATFYYALRALDAQEQILRQTVAAFTEQVRVVSAQLKNGLVGPIDLYQAQSQLEATQAQWRDVQRARADEEHALAILCGQAAPSFSVTPNPLLEAAPPEVPAGLPAQLLTRRPDVAEAEQTSTRSSL
jgi:multidrug efflux system outer membrane protein